jgi:hypothetical protein
MNIDIDSLDIRSTADTRGRVAKAIKAHNDRLYVALSTSHDCRLQHGVEVAEVDSQLSLQTVLKYEGVNDIVLWDFAALQNLLIVTGSVRVQLPTTLLRAIIPVGKISAGDPVFWEQGEERSNGFILADTLDGTPVADRVFPDLLNRSINRIVATEPDKILGVGAALGDRGWIVELEAPTSDRPRPTAEH